MGPPLNGGRDLHWQVLDLKRELPLLEGPFDACSGAPSVPQSWDLTAAVKGIDLPLFIIYHPLPPMDPFRLCFELTTKRKSIVLLASVLANGDPSQLSSGPMLTVVCKTTKQLSC